MKVHSFIIIVSAILIVAGNGCQSTRPNTDQLPSNAVNGTSTPSTNLLWQSGKTVEEAVIQQQETINGVISSYSQELPVCSAKKVLEFSEGSQTKIALISTICLNTGALLGIEDQPTKASIKEYEETIEALQIPDAQTRLYKLRLEQPDQWIVVDIDERSDINVRSSKKWVETYEKQLPENAYNIATSTQSLLKKYFFERLQAKLQDYLKNVQVN